MLELFLKKAASPSEKDELEAKRKHEAAQLVDMLEGAPEPMGAGYGVAVDLLIRTLLCELCSGQAMQGRAPTGALAYKLKRRGGGGRSGRGAEGSDEEDM